MKSKHRSTRFLITTWYMFKSNRDNIIPSHSGKKYKTILIHIAYVFHQLIISWLQTIFIGKTRDKQSWFSKNVTCVMIGPAAVF